MGGRKYIHTARIERFKQLLRRPDISEFFPDPGLKRCEIRRLSRARLPASAFSAPAAIASIAATSSIIVGSRPPFLWTRLVHSEAPPIEFDPVQRANRALGFCAGTHLDEAETFGPAGEFVVIILAESTVPYWEKS